MSVNYWKLVSINPDILTMIRYDRLTSTRIYRDQPVLGSDICLNPETGFTYNRDYFSLIPKQEVTALIKFIKDDNSQLMVEEINIPAAYDSYDIILRDYDDVPSNYKIDCLGDKYLETVLHKHTLINYSFVPVNFTNGSKVRIREDFNLCTTEEEQRLFSLYPDFLNTPLIISELLDNTAVAVVHPNGEERLATYTYNLITDGAIKTPTIIISKLSNKFDIDFVNTYLPFLELKLEFNQKTLTFSL